MLHSARQEPEHAAPATFKAAAVGVQVANVAPSSRGWQGGCTFRRLETNRGVAAAQNRLGNQGNARVISIRTTHLAQRS